MMSGIRKLSLSKRRDSKSQPTEPEVTRRDQRNLAENRRVGVATTDSDKSSGGTAISPIPGGTNAAKIALRHKHKYVVENLPADDVALEMFTGSKGLLTEKEHEVYRSMRDTYKPNFARAEFLLECLKKRGPGSFRCFLGILQKFPASQHIATELRKEYVEVRAGMKLSRHRRYAQKRRKVHMVQRCRKMLEKKNKHLRTHEKLLGVQKAQRQLQSAQQQLESAQQQLESALQQLESAQQQLQSAQKQLELAMKKWNEELFASSDVSEGESLEPSSEPPTVKLRRKWLQNNRRSTGSSDFDSTTSTPFSSRRNSQESIFVTTDTDVTSRSSREKPDLARTQKRAPEKVARSAFQSTNPKPNRQQQRTEESTPSEALQTPDSLRGAAKAYDKSQTLQRTLYSPSTPLARLAEENELSNAEPNPDALSTPNLSPHKDGSKQALVAGKKFHPAQEVREQQEIENEAQGSTGDECETPRTSQRSDMESEQMFKFSHSVVLTPPTDTEEVSTATSEMSIETPSARDVWITPQTERGATVGYTTPSPRSGVTKEIKKAEVKLLPSSTSTLHEKPVLRRQSESAESPVVKQPPKPVAHTYKPVTKFSYLAMGGENPTASEASLTTSPQKLHDKVVTPVSVVTGDAKLPTEGKASYISKMSLPFATRKWGSRNEAQHQKRSHTIIGGRKPNAKEPNPGRSQTHEPRQLADKSLLKDPHFTARLDIQHQRAESNTPSEAIQELERMRSQPAMSQGACRSRSRTVDVPPGRLQGVQLKERKATTLPPSLPPSVVHPPSPLGEDEPDHEDETLAHDSSSHAQPHPEELDTKKTRATDSPAKLKHTLKPAEKTGEPPFQGMDPMLVAKLAKRKKKIEESEARN